MSNPQQAVTPDDLEFSLCQYADGTLPIEQRSALESRLAADPAARAVLADYRRLGDLLSAPPAGLNWDRLADRLSAAVDADDRPVVAGRIGFGRWVGIALAASAAVVIGIRLLPHHSPQTPQVAERIKPTEPAAMPVVIVTGPSLEAGVGAAVAEVKVGPSPALAARDSSWRYAEGVVSRPPHVVLTRR